MRVRRAAKRGAVVGVVLAAVVGGLVGPTPVGATVQVVVDVSVLRVYLDGAGGETATIGCTGGFASVNGTPSSLSCTTATSIQVTGGPGNDSIDLSAVTAAAFPALTQLTASGGGGNDTLAGGQVDTTLFGDEGVDVLVGGPGDDYLQAYGGADVISANSGDDITFADAGLVLDLGPGDDLVYATHPAGAPASMVAGTGTDELRVSASPLVDKLFVDARPDGSLDLVDTIATSSDVFAVDPSFEQLTLRTTVGNDLVWIDGLSPAVSIDVQGNAGNPTLEVFAKGPVTKTPTTITRGGYAAVTYSGMADAQAFGALPSADHAFVHAANHDLVGAHRSTAQVATNAAKITGGSITRSRYAQQLVATATWREAEAERIFYAYLRRGLDPSGRAHFAERIRTGTKLNTIRASVLGSSEYYREIAASGNARYVDSVYFDVLHRLPDPSGKAYWLGKLNAGVPREQLAASLLVFDEPIREFIRYHHRDLLGREPTTAELATWRTRVRDQATGERDLQVSLVGSAAYRARHA